MAHDNAPQSLSAIVANRPPWFRAWLSTILVWPTIRRDWVAILSYAHYTTTQPGETAPPGVSVTYPHDSHHPVTLDGDEVAAALGVQVRELEDGENVGRLTVSWIPEPPGTPLGSPPTTG